jgi:hypothetical protein
MDMYIKRVARFSVLISIWTVCVVSIRAEQAGTYNFYSSSNRCVGSYMMLSTSVMPSERQCAIMCHQNTACDAFTFYWGNSTCIVHSGLSTIDISQIGTADPLQTLCALYRVYSQSRRVDFSSTLVVTPIAQTSSSSAPSKTSSITSTSTPASTSMSTSVSSTAQAPQPPTIANWELQGHAVVGSTTVAYYCTESTVSSFSWSASKEACERAGWQLADLNTLALWNAATSLNEANSACSQSTSREIVRTLYY